MSRRAETFDAALASTSPQVLDARTAELLQVVGALSVVPAPAPARPGYVADLRARLLVEAEVALRPAEVAPMPTPPAGPSLAPPLAGRRTSRGERRLSAALAAFALVGATGSMAVAARSALPGDVLYPVKRAMENADTGLSAQDHRGGELLQHASSRLVELDELNRRGGGPTRAVVEATMRDTLTTFSAQAREASDLLMLQYAATGDQSAIAQLEDFTAAGVISLVDLQATLPVDVRPAVLDAAAVVFTIDQEAAAACPECAGNGLITLPSALVSATTTVPSDRTEESGSAVDPTDTLVVPSPVDQTGGLVPDGSDPMPAAPPTAVPTAPSAPTATPSATASGAADGATRGGRGVAGGRGGAPTQAPLDGAALPTRLPSVGIPAAPGVDTPGVDQLLDDATSSVLGTLRDPLLGR